MRITVLIENSAPEGLVAEHGLSFYLEYRGGRYLLDAGESGAFLLNAQRLGVDLSRVEAAALSHGHYDHGDGFTAFFRPPRRAGGRRTGRGARGAQPRPVPPPRPPL